MKTHLNSRIGDVIFVILSGMLALGVIGYAIYLEEAVDSLKSQAVQSGCAYWEVDQVAFMGIIIWIKGSRA